MLIDNPNEIKKLLLKLVAVPRNSDVVLYNNKFVDLVNVDVEKLYFDELNKFKELEAQYKELEAKISDFNDRLNNTKLIDNKMSEEEYISQIQKLEIEYATKFRDIKNLEIKISSLKNAIVGKNNLLEMQKAQEIKDKKERVDNLNNKRAEIIKSMTNLTIVIKNYEIQIELLQEKIALLREEEYMYEWKTKPGKDFVCLTCMSKISDKDTIKKIREKFKANRKRINEKYDNVKAQLLEAKQEKQRLSNNYEKLKKQSNDIGIDLKIENHLYQRKSKEVLKIEGDKFALEEELEILEEEYKQKAKEAGVYFYNLKNKINNYKESLLNLHDIKQDKDKINEDVIKFNEIREKAIKLKENLILHCEFLFTRNKIIEKRMGELFDNKITFKMSEVENKIYIKEMFEIFYNKINLKNLKLEEEMELEQLILDRVKYMN